MYVHTYIANSVLKNKLLYENSYENSYDYNKND